MANTVYLHLGTPKSGTTYIQSVLATNKRRLASEARLLYPGERWSDQVRAVRDVIDANPHGQRDAVTEGAWRRLVDEIVAWDGDAVVSMEWLGSAGPRTVPTIVSSLHPARVEVVVTVRDLARTIPAAWQEFVQNWHAWTWAEFLTAISDENPKSTQAGRVFWVQQDLARLLAVWRDVLPPEQVHVVTLPPRGAPAGELWNRFASVLGVDAHRFDATGKGGNESLGLESTELMLRVNRASRLANMPWDTYRATLKEVVAKRGLARRKPVESAVAIPKDLHDWVRACAAEQVAAVRASQAQVVGDLADLEPRTLDDGVAPEAVPDTAVLDAAVDALVFLAEERDKESRRLRKDNDELRRRLRAQRRRARRTGAAAAGDTEPSRRGAAAVALLRRGLRKARRVTGGER